ncbi:hypothetical protein IQ252_03775 [Tychonema sp. LEGE 07203]|nr:hypothetical protein [Tychonema sp. LEGE 07203]
MSPRFSPTRYRQLRTLRNRVSRSFGHESPEISQETRFLAPRAIAL